MHAEKDLAKLTQMRNELLASGKTSEKGTKSLVESINKRIQAVEEANANKQQLKQLDDDLAKQKRPSPKTKESGTFVESSLSEVDYASMFVKTPYGDALQATTKEALAARTYVESGGKLYRIGTTGRSQAAEAQFWATENPLANPQAFAKKYGIPVENILNANFIEIGTLKSGTGFITRSAPAAPGNPSGWGGGIEVVTPINGVKLESFSIIK